MAPVWVRKWLEPGERLIGWSDACPDEMQVRVEGEMARLSRVTRTVGLGLVLAGIALGILVVDALLTGSSEAIVPMIFFAGLMATLIVLAYARYGRRREVPALASELVEEGGFFLTQRRLVALDAQLSALAWVIEGNPVSAVADGNLSEVRVRFRGGRSYDVMGVEAPHALIEGLGRRRV